MRVAQPVVERHKYRFKRIIFETVDGTYQFDSNQLNRFIDLGRPHTGDFLWNKCVWSFPQNLYSHNV